MKDLAAEHFTTVVITDLHIADSCRTRTSHTTRYCGRPFCEEPGRLDVMWGGVAGAVRCFRTSRRQARASGGARCMRTFVKDGVAGFWNDMNEPAVFHGAVEDDAGRCAASHRRAGIPAAHGESSGDSQRLRHGEHARTFDGLLKLEPNVRPFRDDARQLCGRAALCGDVDGRQLEQPGTICVRRRRSR